MNDAITSVWAANEYDETAVPNHILIPYEQYNYILTTMVTDLATETIYDFLLKNNAAAKNGGSSSSGPPGGARARVPGTRTGWWSM